MDLNSSGAMAGVKRRRDSAEGGGICGIKTEAGDDKDPPELLLAASFARKVQSRFETRPHIFEAFFVVLLSWRAGRKSLTEVHDELSLLFIGQGDLLEELQSGFLSTRLYSSAAWLPRQLPPGGSQRQCVLPQSQSSPAAHATQPSNLSRTRDLLAYVRNSLPKDESSYQDFLKLLKMFGDGNVTLVQLRRLVIDTFPDAAQSFNLFLDHCHARSVLDDSEEDAEDPILEAAGQLGVYLNNPLASLDLKGWERVPPSYRRIPSDYPFLESRRKTASKIAAQVINSTWVADTYGLEDNKFKKNQCEEALYGVEDDEYELEILLRSAQSALRSLQPLASRISAMGNEEKSLLRLVRSELPPSVVRIVRTLYLSQLGLSDLPHGGPGSNMLELLLTHPATSVPVLIERLQVSVNQWNELMREMKPAWQQITDLNYTRSLDHASFKQVQQQGLRARGASMQPPGSIPSP